MKNKILPICSPIVCGFSHQSVLTSIMLAYERCTPWVYNNYIQVFTLSNLKKNEWRTGTVDFFFSDYTDFNRGEYKINPWIHYNEIPLSMINQAESDLLLKIIDYISVGYYITLDIDMSYIPLYECKKYAEHTLLIYGYDAKSKVFYCMDNFKKSKISMEKIDFDIVIAALESRLRVYKKKFKFTTSNPGPLLTTIGIVDKISDIEHSNMEQIDLHRIIYLLSSYLEPNSFYMKQSDSNYYAYGVEVYDELIDYFKDCVSSKKHIDFRGLFSFVDHKKLMICRLQYIQGVLNVEFKTCIEEYDKIVRKMEMLILLIIKYNMTHQMKMDEIVDCLKKCMKDETSILRIVIEKLKNVM